VQSALLEAQCGAARADWRIRRNCSARLARSDADRHACAHSLGARRRSRGTQTAAGRLLLSRCARRLFVGSMECLVCMHVAVWLRLTVALTRLHAGDVWRRLCRPAWFRIPGVQHTVLSSGLHYWCVECMVGLCARLWRRRHAVSFAINQCGAVRRCVRLLGHHGDAAVRQWLLCCCVSAVGLDFVGWVLGDVWRRVAVALAHRADGGGVRWRALRWSFDRSAVVRHGVLSCRLCADDVVVVERVLGDVRRGHAVASAHHADCGVVRRRVQRRHVGDARLPQCAVHAARSAVRRLSRLPRLHRPRQDESARVYVLC
jgi:hypothetical protein